MSVLTLAADLIRQHEGEVKHRGVHVVYDDATGEPIVHEYTVKGHPTIGVGRHLAERGLSDAEAAVLFENDLDVAWDAAFNFVGRETWDALSDARCAALMDAAHALGPTRLRRFVKLRVALQRGDYDAAAAELLDSKWQRDLRAKARTGTVTRVERLAAILRSGEMEE